jgi:LuxR family maltose regulon positive regulatory protein
MILALDDYQVIHNQAVHAAVTFLIEHQPAALHLVIATRSDPPLPLARLRARGQTVELRAADLRFTTPEAAQFLNDVMGLPLDESAVALLEERTEGWIAGLQLAALSMRDRKDVRGFIEGFSGTNRHILDYLMEEVLASQPAEIQHFLLHTSILERLCAPLCDALVENREQRTESSNGSLLSVLDSRSILQFLERENLFLVSLDDERTWFRYHHLFADLLRARLQQAQAGLVPRLHTRAAAWLEQNGYVPQAIQHFAAAQEMTRAADLIEQYGPVHWAESDPAVVQLAESLPPEMLITRPKIGLYRAWHLIILGRIELALPLLNDLLRHLAAADAEPGQGWMHMLVGLMLAFLGQRANNPGFDPLPDERILDEIPADERVLRDVAEILYGMTLGRHGETDRAAEIAEKCIRQHAFTTETLAIPTLATFLARVYLIQGRLHAAAELCHKYLDPMREKGIRFLYSAGSLNVVLGEALYEWNHLEEAEQQIREGLRANEPWADIMSDAFGLLAQARLLQTKGDTTGAMHTVEKFENRLRSNLRPREFEGDVRTLRVSVQLAGGDLHGAVRWAEQIRQSEDFRHHADDYRLTLARIRLAQGRYADAEEMLAGSACPTESGNSITRQIECELTLAAALAGQQRQAEAVERLAACLALAEPEGYVRVFLDGGQPVRELLTAYLRMDGVERKPYAQMLLSAFSPAGKARSSVSQPTEFVEALTEREIEVLRLMALGRTNQEIAETLIVARGTIKAHAASIYRKLDASNRTEAVARARGLGILT